VHGVRPGLSVILVGEDRLAGYVRNKIRDCAEVGIRSELIELPATLRGGAAGTHRRLNANARCTAS
jgi:5,10-methylene-tetrahydrofolate dehydrogenase/methenyl tetrahydrofolate cyclohydrolase